MRIPSPLGGERGSEGFSRGFCAGGGSGRCALTPALSHRMGGRAGRCLHSSRGFLLGSWLAGYFEVCSHWGCGWSYGAVGGESVMRGSTSGGTGFCESAVFARVRRRNRGENGAEMVPD